MGRSLHDNDCGMDYIRHIVYGDDTPFHWKGISKVGRSDDPFIKTNYKSRQ